MPVVSTKHKERDFPGSFRGFSGGLNEEVLATGLGINELSQCKNMKYFIYTDVKGEKRIGAKTRQGTTKISNTALPAGADVLAATYYVNQSQYIVATAAKVYYLDGSLDPIEIGSLSGIPTFTEFHNKLIIHDGAITKSWDGTTFENLTCLYQDELLGTGDGSETRYEGTLAHPVAKAGSVSITFSGDALGTEITYNGDMESRSTGVEKVTDGNIEALGAEKVTGGAFDAADNTVNWAFGANWSDDPTNDEADAAAATTDLEQDISSVATEMYKLVFTLRNAGGGTLRTYIGATIGDTVSTNNIYTHYITAADATNLKFDGLTAFTGSITDVSVKKVTASALANWTADAHCTIASVTGGQAGSYCLEITRVDENEQEVTQAITGLTVGLYYRLTLYVKNVVGFSAGLYSAAHGWWGGEYSASGTGAWVQHTIDIKALATTATLKFKRNSSSATVLLIDTVSLQENRIWETYSGATVASDTGADGTGYSTKITANGVNDGIEDTLTVVATSTYRLTLNYKNTAGDVAQYQVYDVSNAGNIIAITDLSDSTAWDDFLIEFDAPAGCTSVTIRLLAKANGDIVWFDDASLKVVSGTDTYTITDSSGALIGDVGIGNNVINTTTGVFDFTCSETPINATSILAEYEKVDGAPKSGAGLVRARRLYLWKDADYPSRLWYSSVNDEDAWDTSSGGGYEEVNADDGYDLLGCLTFFQSLLLIKEMSAHRLDNFPGDTTFRIEPLFDDIGTPAYRTPLNEGNMITFLSEGGWLAMSPSEIYGDIQRLPAISGKFATNAIKKANSYAYTVFNQIDNQLWITLYDSGYDSYCYVYDLDTGGISLYQFAFTHTCYNYANNEMLIGGSDGMLYKLVDDDSTYQDNSVTYTTNTFIRSAFTDFQLPFNKKHNKKAILLIDGNGGSFTTSLELYKDKSYTAFDTTAISVSANDANYNMRARFNYREVMWKLTSIYGASGVSIYGLDLKGAIKGDIQEH